MRDITLENLMFPVIMTVVFGGVCVLGYYGYKSVMHQEYLIDSGYCKELTKEWYQPSPSYRTDCRTIGNSERCETKVIQDPGYTRALMSCVDHDEASGKSLNTEIKFWRKVY